MNNDSFIIETYTLDDMKTSLAELLGTTVQCIDNYIIMLYANSKCIDDYEQNIDNEILNFIESKELQHKLEYVQFFHLSRRLNDSDLKFSTNLWDLLLNESDLSDFLKKYDIEFELIDNEIHIFYKGNHIDLRKDDENSGNLLYRLGYLHKKSDYCVNGFAFRLDLEKNHYTNTLRSCPEFIYVLSRYLNHMEIVKDYNENSKYYCIEYRVPLNDVIFDEYNVETIEEKVKKYLSKVIYKLYKHFKYWGILQILLI